MVIHNIESRERKGYQHWCILWYCIDHWYMLNNADYPSYPYIMNIITCRYNEEHECHVALTYHFNPKKW